MYQYDGLTRVGDGVFWLAGPVEGRRQEQPHFRETAGVSRGSNRSLKGRRENGTYDCRVFGKSIIKHA